MRGILIDPEERTVIEIHKDFADFREIQETIQGHFTVAGYFEAHAVFVHDEGMFACPNHVFTIMPHYGHPLMGKILLLRALFDGDCTDADLPVETVRDQIQFISRDILFEKLGIDDPQTSEWFPIEGDSS